uniref:Uncharacterized protein n=1 Tax=Setaria digitata TaxID=48799 RepID=A0A915PP73_9BILA
MIVVLDGLLPRICRSILVSGSTRSADVMHSLCEDPRPVVHNVPPGYDPSQPPQILPIT